MNELICFFIFFEDNECQLRLHSIELLTLYVIGSNDFKMIFLIGHGPIVSNTASFPVATVCV